MSTSRQPAQPPEQGGTVAPLARTRLRHEPSSDGQECTEVEAAGVGACRLFFFGGHINSVLPAPERQGRLELDLLETSNVPCS
jgi:hypothetical protein